MAASPSAALLGGSSLVDCTQLIHEDTFGFFGCFFQRQILIDTRAKADQDAEEVGFRKEKYMMGCDVGTHIDSPNHFISGGRCIHELSMDELTAPGVVIDVSAKVQADGGADYELTVEDVAEWEATHGPIPPRSLVCMKTNWGDRFASATSTNDGGEYLNKDETGAMHFPGFSADVAQYLVSERDIAGIGIDTPSLDNGLSTTFPVHVIILGADKYQIENMHLAGVPEGQSCTFVSLPLKIKGGPEAEARVMAVLK